MFVVVAISSASFTDSAKAEGHAAGLQVGQVWLAGNISDNAENSIGYGAFYEYTASEVFALQVNLLRSSHDEILTLTSSTVGFKANLFFYDQLVPYALLGMGLYFTSEDLSNSTVTENVSATVFGLNLGIGADLNLGEMFFAGFQFNLHNLFSSNVKTDNFGEVEVSGRWTGFIVRSGVRF